jgi:hypothetical protein
METRHLNELASVWTFSSLDFMYHMSLDAGAHMNPVSHPMTNSTKRDTARTRRTVMQKLALFYRAVGLDRTMPSVF